LMLIEALLKRSVPGRMLLVQSLDSRLPRPPSEAAAPDPPAPLAEPFDTMGAL